jgi:hypothetical protein
MTPLPAGHRLDEYRLMIAPHDYTAERVDTFVEFNDLLIFLVLGSMIEANEHPGVVESSPAFRANQIAYFESYTLRRIAGRGGVESNSGWLGAEGSWI